MPQATAGHYTRLAYLWEDNGFLADPADTDMKPFGIDTQLTTKEGANNAVRLFNPDDPRAQQIIEQNFSGTFTVEFTLTNPWWLRAVIGESSDDGNIEPTEHTWDIDDDFPGDSMRLLVGNTQTSTFKALKGCVVQTATITFEIPGTVNITLDGAYADEDATQSSFDQPPVQYRALSYHDSSIDRGGDTLEFVQSLEVTINTNADMIQELGERKAVDYSPKQFNPGIDYARIRTDTPDQERFYGGAESIQDSVENTADITILADNEKTGADKNSLELSFPNVFPDSVSASGVGDPESDVEDALTELGRDMTAVALNDETEAR